MVDIRKAAGALNRRDVLAGMGAATAGASLGLTSNPGWANTDAEIIKSHGYSYFGSLKYPADFPHFDYVNPDAPKGGEISISTRGTFDSFNRYAWTGKPGLHSGLMAEAMFSRAPFGASVPSDSIIDSYCHIAREVEYPKTKEWCVFHMRKDVTFSDGSPLTAHDAAFTHNLFLEQGIRSYARAVKERVTGVQVIDDHTIRFTFADGISRRSLISQVGGTPVFSQAWYERTGEKLDKPSLQTQIGSGPYVLDDYEINRYIVYRRNPDYWGWHLPVNVGRHNFDTVRIEYFADDAAEFEAFKAGLYTFRQEASTKKWATGYDNFKAFENGHVTKSEIPNGSPPSPQGFVFNMLREPFTDRTVRKALSLAFNFEWTSASLQYGLTQQRNSFVEGTEIEARGLPEGLEKSFLEGLGDLVPEEIMTTEAVMAHTSNPDRVSDRRNQRKALKLFKSAGWDVGADGKMRGADGEAMTFKVMISSSTSDTAEALISTYVETLNKWGITASVEKIDSAQYAQRYYDKDWDMMYFRNQTFLAAGTGNEQAYGSKTAVVSSYNPQSLQSELVDAILEASLHTTSREEEVASLMALDRVLRYLHIQIPSGYVPDHWVAAYDIYGRPEEIPPLDLGALDFWWFDQEKYDALKAQGVLR